MTLERPPEVEPDRRLIVELETILPAGMAQRAVDTGVKRVTLDFWTLLSLSVLAGAFISFGAVFATTVSAGAAWSNYPYGLVRLASGLVFSVGLLIVVIAGAELFTGNNMIVMAWASGRVSTRAMLANWAVVYVGNCIGALAMAVLMYLSRQYTFADGAVGLAALSAANAKAQLAFGQAIVLGVLCNALVCLAIWMCYAARTTIDRVVTIVPPVAAFVACGFEHSIANVYFLPVGLLIKDGAPPSFWSGIGKTPDDFSALTWGAFLVDNLLPVTIGNVIGGSLMVAAVYWFVYLRPGGSYGSGK
jgi:formate transporter